MSKTFLEALTSVGKNLQSGVDKLKETKANVVSLEQYCGSEDAGYKFFLKCNSMSANTEKQIWEIPYNKTLILKHYVIIPPNVTIRGGNILMDNSALDTFQSSYGGMIVCIKDNIAFDGVNITVNNANQGMTLFAVNGTKNFTVKDCRISLNGTVKYQAMFYFFSKNQNVRFVNTDIISNSPGVNGSPILISNQTTDTTGDYISKNFIFDNCYIESNSGDEVIAIMSQVNLLENVSFNNCTIIREAGSAAKFIITIFSKNQTSTTSVNTRVNNVGINNCTIIDRGSSTINNMLIRIGYTGNIDSLKNVRIKNCQLYGNIPVGQEAIAIETVESGGCIRIDGCYIENTADTSGYAIYCNDTSNSVEVINCDVTNLTMYSDSSKSYNKNNKLEGVVQDYFAISQQSIGENGYMKLENGMTLQWIKHKSITAVDGAVQTIDLPKRYTNFYGAWYSTFNSTACANVSIVNSGIQQIKVTNFASTATMIDILCLTA